MTTTNDRALQPVPEPAKKVVSWEDLAAEQHIDIASTRYVGVDPDPDDEDEQIVLLDPIVAYRREAARMKAAGPRRRITADDLDRRAP